MKKLTLIFACVISIYYCKAQPSNDSCGGATALPSNFSTCVTTNGTVLGATPSGQPATCGGTPSDDVWYIFTASSTCQTIAVAGSVGFDAVFELFSSNPCGGTGTSIGCMNATGLGGTETSSFAGLTAGMTYWIRVYDFIGAPTTYTFTICVNTSGAQSSAFNYSSNVYCNSGANPTPTITGVAGGTFSSTAGLTWVSTLTGQIDLAISTPGTYIITYTSPGPCASSSTFNVTITAMSVATFSYIGSPFCQGGANPSPTFTGGGVGGTFSSTAGLVFVSTGTGQVDLFTSLPGTYTVTNTIAASGSCGAVTATSTITIGAQSTASFSYTGTPYCQSGANAFPTFAGGSVAGTFTSNVGLVINASTGEVTCMASAVGTYTVTNTIAASGGCPMTSATATITIINAPVATFSYMSNPYCEGGNNGWATFMGGGYAGIFTAAPAGLVVDSITGTVDLVNSIPGTYIVTNTVNGFVCPNATDTAAITINAGSVVNIGPDVTLPCGATTYTLSTPAVLGATLYIWTVGGPGVSITGGQGTTMITVVMPTFGMNGTWQNTCTAFGSLICPTYTSDTMYLTVGTQAINFNIMPDSTNAYNYTMFNATYGGGLTYSWDFGDGSAVSTAMSPSHTYASAGTYAVCLTANNGACTGTVCDTVVVTGVLNSCNALFNVAHDTASANPNAYIITNLSFGNNLSYTWSFGDTATSTAVHPTHTYANIGPYQLCLTIDDGAGCVQSYCDSLFAVDSLHTHLQPISIVVVGNNPGTTVGVNKLTMNKL